MSTLIQFYTCLKQTEQLGSNGHSVCLKVTDAAESI